MDCAPPAAAVPINRSPARIRFRMIPAHSSGNTGMVTQQLLLMTLHAIAHDTRQVMVCVFSLANGSNREPAFWPLVVEGAKSKARPGTAIHFHDSMLDEARLPRREVRVRGRLARYRLPTFAN